MTAIRTPGPVNPSTTLIDVGLWGVEGTGSAYLVRAGRTCLVDTGSRPVAGRLAATLRALDAWPPDMVILTHAHYDHSQGVPPLRRRFPDLRVMAGRDSVPLLADQSWNRLFPQVRRLVNVPGVQPLDDGEVIDLDGLTLEVIDTPGHTPGHIALLDRENSNLLAGDVLGFCFGGQTLVPSITARCWDPRAFDSSLARLRSVEFGSVCIGHFGCISGDEAGRLVESAERSRDLWWSIMERVAGEEGLDDIDRLTGILRTEAEVHMPDLRVWRPGLRALLGLVNGGRRLVGRPPLTVAEVLFPQLVQMLVDGYRCSVGEA